MGRILPEENVARTPLPLREREGPAARHGAGEGEGLHRHIKRRMRPAAARPLTLPMLRRALPSPAKGEGAPPQHPLRVGRLPPHRPLHRRRVLQDLRREQVLQEQHHARVASQVEPRRGIDLHHQVHVAVRAGGGAGPAAAKGGPGGARRGPGSRTGTRGRRRGRGAPLRGPSGPPAPRPAAWRMPSTDAAWGETFPSPGAWAYRALISPPALWLASLIAGLRAFLPRCVTRWERRGAAPHSAGPSSPGGSVA